MIKVSTTGIVVPLKTDLRFPIPGQWGHGSRIIHFARKIDLKISEKLLQMLKTENNTGEIHGR